MTRLSILFDTAIARLQAQDKKAYDEEKDICRYRFEDCACLFGHMISDENYDEDIEGNMGNDTTILQAIEKSTGIYLLDYLDKPDITLIQEAHDEFWEPGKDFKSLIPEDISVKIWPENAIA